ncbi:MAG: response regulator transcription factor [Proteobacteria bacterium]|nr:response regulator transcription factor [Pseudomonadota bacterium]
MNGDDSPLLHFTYRQREVLGLLTEGLSNKVIAGKLDIREVTVKLHLKNIYKLLGAQNRTHAVHIALKLGWSA